MTSTSDTFLIDTSIDDPALLSTMYTPSLTTTAIGATSLYVFLWALLHFTQDANEPQTIEHMIPFLGPILGMMRRGSDFHNHMRNKYNLPIYTLRLPGSRLYVVTDTSLIPVIQRQVKTLSISPIMVRVFSHFMGVSKQALDIMGRDPIIEHHGSVHQITLQRVEGLQPGRNLDQSNAQAAANLSHSLATIGTTKSMPTVNLLEWLAKEIMLATTNAVYGQRNPFKDPRVQAAFPIYESGLTQLITGFLPTVIAKKNLDARNTIVEAFVKYYDEGGHRDKSSSVYAQNRHNYPSELSIRVEDIAKMEAGRSVGLLSNTMPATFWTVYHIFSDPVLLRDCRREVEDAVYEEDGRSYLDMSHIKASCPILVATMQEAFRFHSIGQSARAVVEDHMLNGKYLLKKGATLLIPSTVQHGSPDAWGEDFDEFQPKRFIRTTEGNRYNSTAFRAFGGGVNLCPGRHFATTEILAFVSIMLLRLDMEPTNGRWDTSGYREANAAFRLPNRDVRVQLVPRDTREWHVVFSAPGKPMDLTTTNLEPPIDDQPGNYATQQLDHTAGDSHILSLGWIGSLVVDVPRDPSLKIKVRSPVAFT